MAIEINTSQLRVVNCVLPTLIMLVRVYLPSLGHPRQNICWMVAVVSGCMQIVVDSYTHGEAASLCSTKREVIL